MGGDDLEAALMALVGAPMGPPTTGPDPVNQPMIRHWAAAFEDANPVSTDVSFAATTRFGEVVAPPMMLQTWTMSTPVITGIAERGGAPVPATGPSPLRVLDEAGFTGTLAANSTFEVERYLCLDERVSAASVVESVSDRKQTRLGEGYFVTWVTTFTAGDGEVVGRHRFRVFKFRPQAAS